MFDSVESSVGKWAIKNAPTIIAATAAAGVVLTAVAAGKATIKAKKALEEIPEDADMKEKAKVVAPIMAKPFLLGAATIACIFLSNHEHLKREAALAACYTLSSKALSEYEEKAVEVVGKKKAREIKDKIAESTVENNQPPESMISDEDGKVLCLDKWTGKYFRSKIEDIDRVQNELNYLLNIEGFVSLNEWYERLGLEGVQNGEDIGWNLNNDGLIELDRSSQLYNNNTPVLVLTFSVSPKQYFDSAY